MMSFSQFTKFIPLSDEMAHDTDTESLRPFLLAQISKATGKIFILERVRRSNWGIRRAKKQNLPAAGPYFTEVFPG